MLGSSRVAAQLAASQEGLSSMSELFICATSHNAGKLFPVMTLKANLNGRTEKTGENYVSSLKIFAAIPTGIIAMIKSSNIRSERHVACMI
jgi:hypothetical protein